MANVQIYPNMDALARSAAELFISLANTVIEKRNLFSIALSGGSTPQSLYALLASAAYRKQVDWSKVQVFWGDERYVPADHPDSNYLKAQQTLLSKIPIPTENIHRVPTELTPPERAAEAYEEELLAYFSACPDEQERNQASFDLVLLGMGDDGHTASLFPGSPAIREQTRWVAAQYVDKLAAWQITLTPAILNRASNILFIISGSDKSTTLQRVVYGSYQPERYPAQIIQPTDGNLVWMVDEDAAMLF